MEYIALALPLIGCSNGTISNVKAPSEVEANVYKKFIGVPLLAGAEGTYVRINNEWIITARHNRVMFPFSDWYEHPDCDVALVRLKGEGGLDYALAYHGDNLLHSGFPIGRGFTSTAGHYLSDIIIHQWSDCQMSASTGVTFSGMSGGAVTKDGKLVGIITGYATEKVTWDDGMTYDRPLIFTSINYIREWMDKTIRENK